MESKHGKHWLLGGLGVSLVLVLTAVLVFRSQSFHNYVLSKIIEAAQTATGGRVEIASYDVHVGPLHVDLYDAVIHGTEGPTEKPLARADHLGVTLKIISTLLHKVDVKEIVIDHPNVNFRIDAAGHSNMPGTPNSNGKTNIFDLAINHLTINRGELLYNDRQTVLNADVHDLASKISFDGLKRQYSGTIVYSVGRVKFGNLSPVEHRVDSAFTIGETAASLDSLKLTSGSSLITAQAKLQNYASPVIDGQYRIQVSLNDVNHLMGQSALRNGEVASEGLLHYENSANRPVLEAVLLQGTLSSAHLGVSTSQFRTDLNGIHSHYKLQNGDVTAPDLRVELLGGSVNAGLSARHIATVADVRVRGAIHSISLESLGALAMNGSTRLPVAGRTEGTFEANWQGRINNLQARVDASVTATSKGARQESIPVNGMLHARYDAPHALLSLRQSYLRTPATVLQFDGSIGNQASLTIQANSTNLHELDMLALGFRQASTPAGQPSPAAWGLYGNGQFSGRVTGTTKDPHLTGQLLATSLQVQQSHWRSLKTSVDASSRSAALQNGELISAANGRINFNATAELRNWSYTPSNQIHVRLQGTGLQATELEQLANLHYPISGTVAANITFDGTQLTPQGQGTVQLANGKIWDQPVQTASVNFRGTGQSIQTTLKVQASAGSANANVDYSPRTEAYQVALDARINNLSSLEALRSRNIQSQGPVTLRANGRGTLKDPELQATLDVPKLTMGANTVSGVKGTLQLAQHRGNFDLVSSVANAAVNAHGTVELKDSYYANVTLDTKAFPLDPILATYFPDNADVHGQLDVHANFQGPLKDTARIEATLEIPTLKIDYQDLHVANSGAIRVAYRNGVVDLAHAELKGKDTDLQFRGTIPIRSAAALNVSIHGDADLILITLLDKQTDASGQLSLNLTVRGDRAHPNLDGYVRLKDAAYSTPTSPLGVQNVSGEINIANNKFEITKLTGESGGGNFTAHGYMMYGAKPVFNLRLDANTIRLRYPEGLRAIFDGQLTLNGSTEDANLNGNVNITRLSFTQQFDLATFISQFADTSSAPPSEGFANNIQLNVGVQSGGNLGLESTKVSLQGDANLRVIGTAAMPVITGRANITDGELFFLNNRYKIERAVLEFANPVRTEPVINLLATTKVNNFDLTINMVGPMDRLRTNYISDPPLPPVDIINLLTRGTTTEAAAPANLGANSLLAKGLASQVSSQVGKLAGISNLQIDPLIGGGNRNPSARVAIQQRITKEIIFTYAADVASTQNELIQVEYQVTPTWSVRVLRDETGSFSIEGRLRKSF